MRNQPPAIGDVIKLRCRKCRKTTPHTILALDDERPSQVRCEACQHLAAPRKTPVRPPVDHKKPEREAWAALRPQLDSSRATAYSMTAPCKVKALIDHPTFGLGVVQRACGPQKMVVLFTDGEKIMRCQ